MSLGLEEEALTAGTLAQYAAIPIAFVVDRILAVTLRDGGLGGVMFSETAVTDPYVQDGDAIEGVRNWGLTFARRDGARVGGAVRLRTG